MLTMLLYFAIFRSWMIKKIVSRLNVTLVAEDSRGRLFDWKSDEADLRGFLGKEKPRR